MVMVSNGLDNLVDHPGRLRFWLKFPEYLFYRRRDGAHYSHYHRAEFHVAFRKSATKHVHQVVILVHLLSFCDIYRIIHHDRRFLDLDLVVSVNHLSVVSSPRRGLILKYQLRTTILYSDIIQDVRKYQCVKTIDILPVCPKLR